MAAVDVTVSAGGGVSNLGSMTVVCRRFFPDLVLAGLLVQFALRASGRLACANRQLKLVVHVQDWLPRTLWHKGQDDKEAAVLKMSCET